MTSGDLRPATSIVRRIAFAVWLACALLIEALPAVAVAAAPAAGIVSQELSVSGAVKTPLSLKVDDLKAFPPEQVVTVTVMRKVDDKDVPTSVRGVRLTALLERAGLANKEPNDWKHTVVMATATDGYKVVFSWPELFDTEVGTGVLVVFERDGQPLADREGRIALVSGRDIKTGPRSVRWLNRIGVAVLQE